MKKLLFLAGVIVIMFSFAFKSEAYQNQAGIVSTGGSNLNIRSAASTSSSIKGQLSNGSYITIRGENGGFYYVEYKTSTYGYISKDYVNVVNSRSATTLANLNIRKSDSTSSSVLTTLPNGSSLLILSSSTYWSKVLCNGGTVGYAYNTYLKSSSTTNTYKLNIVNYKQFDTRWKNEQIVPGKTIGQIGCLTTAFAMTESYRLSTTLTPKNMLSRLSYTSSGDAYWPSNYTTSTSSNYLTTIYNNLKEGKPTIVGGKGASMHFVVVTGVSGDSSKLSSYTINDPGSSYRYTLADFFNSYPTFYKLAYYRY